MPELLKNDNPDVAFGVAEISADGGFYVKVENVAFRRAGYSYSLQNGETVFVPSWKGAMCKFKSYLLNSQKLAELDEKKDVTITITPNTGQTFIMPHAVKTEPSEFSKDGFDLEFHSSESKDI